MIRWLFFADTPLQLYNSYLIASDISKNGEVADVLVYGQFSDAKSLASVYAQTNRFSTIYICEPQSCVDFKDLFLWQLSVCVGKNRLHLQGLPENSYDYYAIACPTPATFDILRTLRKKNPNVKTVFYEDGTGAYNGNIFRQPFYFDKPPDKSLRAVTYVRIIQSLFSIFPNKKILYSPSKLCLKRPELLQYQLTIPCAKIPIDPEAIQSLKRVLPPVNNVLPKKQKIIFLDVPRTARENTGANIIDHMIEIAQQLNTPCLLRTHPRSTFASSYSEKCIDFSTGSWELICQTPNIDNAILISVGSSAQLAPFIETGKKPFLVFLHRLVFKRGTQI